METIPIKLSLEHHDMKLILDTAGKILAHGFALILLFALKSGAYVSDVRVTIADATGRTVLDATSDGPWFLTKLPAGTYQIVATLAGRAIKQPLSVGTARLKTIDFRWASE